MITIGTNNDNPPNNNAKNGNLSERENPQPKQVAKDRYDGHESDQWPWALICDDVKLASEGIPPFPFIFFSAVISYQRVEVNRKTRVVYLHQHLLHNVHLRPHLHRRSSKSES